ncbi:MAG: hypothetical protein KIT69_12490 [Propionibacteriaceae bacterium]|nr:hypothetical protein [Propionibacteriaceae bacterium]
MSLFFVLDSKGDVIIRDNLFVNSNIVINGNFIVGTGNSDAGSSSVFALGDNNTFTGISKLLINGNNNTFLQGINTVFGDFNTINGTVNLICGMNNNLINGMMNFICGMNIMHNGNLGFNTGDSNTRDGNLGLIHGNNILLSGVSNNALGDNIQMNLAGDDNFFFGQNIIVDGFERNFCIGKNIRISNNRNSTFTLAPNGCLPNSIYENPSFPGSGLIEPPINSSLVMGAQNGIYMDAGTAQVQTTLIKYNNTIDPILDITDPKYIATKAYVDNLFPTSNTVLYYEIPTVYATIRDALIDNKTNLVVVSNITETLTLDLTTISITSANIIINPSVVVSYQMNFQPGGIPAPDNTVYYDSTNTFSLTFQGQGTIRFNLEPTNVNPGFFTSGLNALSMNTITFEYLNVSGTATSGISISNASKLRFADLYINIFGALQNFSTAFIANIVGGSFIENIIITCENTIFGNIDHTYPIFDVQDSEVYINNIKIMGTINETVSLPVRIINSQLGASSLTVSNLFSIASGISGVVQTELFILDSCILNNIIGNNNAPINLILRANDSVVTNCTFGGTSGAEIGGDGCVISDNKFENTADITPSSLVSSISISDYMTNIFTEASLNFTNYDLDTVNCNSNMLENNFSIICNGTTEILNQTKFLFNRCGSFIFNVDSYTYCQFTGNSVYFDSMNLDCINTSEFLNISNNIISANGMNLSIGNSGEINTSIINSNLVDNNIIVYINGTNNVIFTSNRTISGTNSFPGTSGAPTVNAQNI